MSDLRELYQEMILDHQRKPRNFREIEDANGRADGYNPLCGDKVTVFVQVRDSVVHDVAFQGSGCAISTASASLMTQSLKGKTEAEARALFASFHALVTGADMPEDGPDLGKLEVFGGVQAYPMRVKCATLAWHTVRAALDEENQPVTTE